MPPPPLAVQGGQPLPPAPPQPHLAEDASCPSPQAPPPPSLSQLVRAVPIDGERGTASVQPTGWGHDAGDGDDTVGWVMEDPDGMQDVDLGLDSSDGGSPVSSSDGGCDSDDSTGPVGRAGPAGAGSLWVGDEDAVEGGGGGGRRSRPGPGGDALGEGEGEGEGEAPWSRWAPSPALSANQVQARLNAMQRVLEQTTPRPGLEHPVGLRPWSGPGGPRGASGWSGMGGVSGMGGASGPGSFYGGGAGSFYGGGAGALGGTGVAQWAGPGAGVGRPVVPSPRWATPQVASGTPAPGTRPTPTGPTPASGATPAQGVPHGAGVHGVHGGAGLGGLAGGHGGSGSGSCVGTPFPPGSRAFGAVVTPFHASATPVPMAGSGHRLPQPLSHSDTPQFSTPHPNSTSLGTPITRVTRSEDGRSGGGAGGTSGGTSASGTADHPGPASACTPAPPSTTYIATATLSSSEGGGGSARGSASHFHTLLRSVKGSRSTVKRSPSAAAYVANFVALSPAAQLALRSLQGAAGGGEGDTPQVGCVGWPDVCCGCGHV
jgi:hypothetical protein